MPAVTADTLTLPRIPSPGGAGTEWRSVVKTVTAHRQKEGEGFQVRRPFPGMTSRSPTRSCCSTTSAPSSTRPARRRARPGTRTAASRPSPT